MRYFSLFVIALFFCQVNAQNYAVQEMTLQLDENGEATLTPEDVLVNTKGTLWALSHGSNRFLKFQYDQESQSLNFVDESDDLCTEFLSFFASYDRNPINRKEYLSGLFIDCCDVFSPYSSTAGCDFSQAFFSFEKEVCDFSFNPPLVFSFDKDGILYEADNNSFVNTFDLNSKIRSFFTDFNLHGYDSGFTYDFENHRLIATSYYLSNNISYVAIDIETGVWNVLFEIPHVNGCIANAIEYIGDDILIVGNSSFNCGGEIYSINLVTQQIVNLASNYRVSDFLFVEDEIPDATLSNSQFTCDDIGEQMVAVTVIENGIPVNYQATVNVVPDFSVRNCPIYRRLTTPDPNGSTDAVLGDYTSEIEVVSSCSSTFTITQSPPPGTLIPYSETETVLLTVTDEFGEMAFCQITVCSDSILANEDQTLQENFIMYPNPTSDVVIIENRNRIPVTNVEILDVNGRLLRVEEVSSDAETVSLSFGSYSSGMYFVKIKSEDNYIVKQIIKE